MFNLMLVDRGKGITTDSEIVHLTDSGAFDRLAELILENGELLPMDTSELVGVMQDGVMAGWEIMGMYI